VDGDVVIALSIGEASCDLNVLGVAAADAVSEAIVQSVRSAPSLGGLPGLAG
jgi:L-aminopeptidase/D-esterase-like protein